MPPDRKKSIIAPVPLNKVLNQVLASCRRKPDLGLTRIWDHWDVVVGTVTAENAQPAAFKGRLLIVHVTSSVWIQQLCFMKDEIKKKINEALGEPLLDEIKFKIGPVHKGQS